MIPPDFHIRVGSFHNCCCSILSMLFTIKCIKIEHLKRSYKTFDSFVTMIKTTASTSARDGVPSNVTLNFLNNISPFLNFTSKIYYYAIVIYAYDIIFLSIFNFEYLETHFDNSHNAPKEIVIVPVEIIALNM